VLVVHWSPVGNTKRILRRGIRKGWRGLFCFPITGIPTVDRWWPRLFRHYQSHTSYNGFVFRLVDEDLPAYFGPWPPGNDEYVHSLAQLEAAVRNTLIQTFGTAAGSIPPGVDSLAETTGISIPDDRTLARLRSNPKFVNWVWREHEIVISRSVSPDRILRVIPGSQLSGRRRRMKHMRQAGQEHSG
jgi:hypothetical protein